MLGTETKSNSTVAASVSVAEIPEKTNNHKPPGVKTKHHARKAAAKNTKRVTGRAASKPFPTFSFRKP